VKSLESAFGPNSALVEELYEQYKENPSSVSDHWKNYFSKLEGETSSDELAEKATKQSTNGVKKRSTQAKSKVKKQKKSSTKKVPEGFNLAKIKGVSSKIVANMNESLEVPTATSLRMLPMKMLIEDRIIINRHLLQEGEPKASFTHFIAWAIVRALEKFPNLNNSFIEVDVTPHKVTPDQ